ncbi:calcium/sodium antiporter [Halobellus rufus]|uniref:calcium/sodium antiporter n=1 Tax=Halobellus rufus TaxID=1448860 RepID=UPI00067865D7|nr:calcium/sodium antiporter [Halobellus rufus]
MVALALVAVLFVGSLLVLLAASDVFTSAAEDVGLAFGVPPFVIGVTIVAGGTSLPELVSSVLAVLQGAPEIVLGSVVGSNVANMLLVLGIAAAVAGDVRIIRELVEVDLPLLVGSAVFLLVATWDSPLVWYEGVLALAALAVYIQFTIAEKDRYVGLLVEEFVGGDGIIDGTLPTGTGSPGTSDASDRVDESGTAADPEQSAVDGERDSAAAAPEVSGWTFVRLVSSLGALFGAAYVLVRSIVDLAAILGVGTELIAITAVAIGTSLPEVFVSVIAVRRGVPELAVGNVLGSNLFNSFLVTGVSSLAGDLVVPASIRSYGLPVMVIVTVLYFFVTQDREITRSEGLTLLLLYALFLLNLGTFR